MIRIFSEILSMSFASSILILAVFVIRLLIKRSPKWTRLILWAFVGLRLLCPITIQSPYSLQPELEKTEYRVTLSNGTPYELSLPSQLPAPISSGHTATRIEMPSLYVILCTLWLLGLFAMILYEIVSYIRISRLTDHAWRDGEIYVTDRASTPFVFGIIKPKIYVPSLYDRETLHYVVAHEKMHISRLDHIWKPLGFAVLSLHWFNPLVWLAYVTFCRDIELACDEKTVKTMNNADKANYAQALLNCSTKRSYISVCPVAFCENSVKERIKTVLKYKKPTLWITVVAIVLCLGVLFFFMTERKNEADDKIQAELDEGNAFGVLPDREKLEEEIRYDFPGIHESAIEYALDIGYNISVKHYKSGASFGHVALLNLAKSVKVKNDEEVELYYMEYYYYDGTISPDESSEKVIYPVFFSLHHNLRTENRTRLCEISNYEMKNKYNTPEMIDEYGDELTATAVEMYREYFFLDMGEKEQMILSAYKAAKEAAGWFRIASILEQQSEYPKEGDTYVELDGIRYFKVKRFPEYQGFVDYLERLFSKELTKEFLEGESKRYINVDGNLYAATGIKSANVHMGDESYAVHNVSDTKYVVEVTVDVYGEDLITVVDQQVYEFPYEFMGDRWVFTKFPEIQ